MSPRQLRRTLILPRLSRLSSRLSVSSAWRERSPSQAFLEVFFFALLHWIVSKNMSFPDKYFSSVILSSCRVATFARAHRASNPSPPARSAAPMFYRGFGYELSLSLSKALESESDSTCPLCRANVQQRVRIWAAAKDTSSGSKRFIQSWSQDLWTVS